MKKRFTLPARLLALSLMLTFLCSCAPAEKEIVTVSGLYPAYTLEQATQAAEYVVLGKVLSKAGPTEVGRATPFGDIRYDCYQRITLEVIECVKGGLSVGDTITYREKGGETARRRYIYEDVTPVEAGQTVMLFIRKDLPLAPDTIWIVPASGELCLSKSLSKGLDGIAEDQSAVMTVNNLLSMTSEIAQTLTPGELPPFFANP